MASPDASNDLSPLSFDDISVSFPLLNHTSSPSSSSDPLDHLASAFDSSRYEPPVMVQKTAVFSGAGGIHKLEGDTLTLDCLVDGSPQPTIVWFKVRIRRRKRRRFFLIIVERFSGQLDVVGCCL